MQKEELLHLHMLLVHVKNYYESVNGEEIITENYNLLEISPVHIHKNKVCHKQAILTLGDELVQYIRQNQTSVVDYSEYSPTAGSRSEKIAEQ